MKYKRIVVDHYGGPDVLRVVEDECPEPRAGEVRINVLAAGVGIPDVMAREGIHPETPRTPYIPGWDLVGVVDRTGQGVTGIEPGQSVVAMPIHGAYSEFICLPKEELVPLPPKLDPAEAVSMVLNYVTAYQMLHRSAHAKAKQRALIHGASGGVGTALLQLGRLIGLEMYGTCSSLPGASTISDLGAVAINYQQQDVISEVRRLNGEGVDLVFDPIGGSHLWHSRKALVKGGKVVGYGSASNLRSEGLGSRRTGRRNRLYGIPKYALYIVGSWMLPGRKRIIPYSIQTLKRLKPQWFKHDLTELLNLLQQEKVKPVIAHRFPLTEAKKAHELLIKGGVVGKIVLVTNAYSVKSEAA